MFFLSHGGVVTFMLAWKPEQGGKTISKFCMSLAKQRGEIRKLQ